MRKLTGLLLAIAFSAFCVTSLFARRSLETFKHIYVEKSLKVDGRLTTTTTATFGDSVDVDITTLKSQLKMGTFGSPEIWNGADEVFEWHLRNASATSQKPVLRVRSSPNIDMTTGVINAAQFQAYGNDTFDIFALRGIIAEAGAKGVCELLTGGTMNAGWFKIEDLGNDLTATGDLFTIELRSQFNDGTTVSGEHAFIRLGNEGSINKQPSALIYHTDGSSSNMRTDDFFKTTQNLSGSSADMMSSGTLTAAGTINSTDVECDARIHVDINGTDYWIALYDTAP